MREQHQAAAKSAHCEVRQAGARSLLHCSPALGLSTFLKLPVPASPSIK